MTPEELKAMEGTEFTYVFASGKTMHAYVKKVDIEKGKASLWSFSLTTDDGTHTFKPLNREEEKENACCVCAPLTMGHILKCLTSIKETGFYISGELDPLGRFKGCTL
jgi:hypothetical protein